MRRIIIFSGINITEGGPLTILRQFYEYADKFLSSDFDIYFLVKEKKLLPERVTINVVEFRNSKVTVFHKIYYEYFKFKSLSKKWRPFLWISLNDCSPSVLANRRVAYWHNPSPFYKISLFDFKFPSITFFQKFYYIFFYAINSKRNDYIIVQQKWLLSKFSDHFGIERKKFIISHPAASTPPLHSLNGSGKATFIFPTMPRVFKNIELIGEAVLELVQRTKINFQVIITISGTENRYSKWLRGKYGGLSSMHFIGKQSSEQMMELYCKADYLIFPSKLETWGLPISEFKITGKPMFVADLPYAHETVGDYSRVCFFNPYSKKELADKMMSVLEGADIFNPHHAALNHDFPIANNLNELFQIIIPTTQTNV